MYLVPPREKIRSPFGLSDSTLLLRDSSIVARGFLGDSVVASFSGDIYTEDSVNEQIRIWNGVNAVVNDMFITF